MTAPRSRAEWQAQADALHADARPFVDGARRAPLADATFEVADAATRRTLVRVPDCGAEDVARAVAAARRAFAGGAWSSLAPGERRAVLLRFAAAIDRESAELALLDSRQMGMPIALAASTMRGAAVVVREYAELVDTLKDELLPGGPHAYATHSRRPHGVVAAITAWNFPVHVALARLAPALATGNAVVLKPSELAPLACLRLADLAHEAGVPAGIVNVLPGRGATAGAALALHPDVDCLAFVGSTATGLRLMQYAGQSSLKSLLLECGGKSPQIVLDDLGDPEALADALVAGFTFNSGQVCVAGTRILVPEALHAGLVEALAERVRRSAVGTPLDPATHLGPLASAAQHARVTAMLGAATASDTLAARGIDADAGPNAVVPHVYLSADQRSPLVQEEIFGPVGCVSTFRDDDEALALANGTRYGLAATVWTRDLARAQRLVRGLRAGYVAVNAVPAPAPSGVRFMSTEPFGQSGIGPDGGAAGLLAYTRLQGVSWNLA